MDHPPIRGEELPYFAKKNTWNPLHTYIDAHSQRIIDEYTGYGVQAKSIFQSQCANMTFADQIRYNRMLHKMVHKGKYSEIN